MSYTTPREDILFTLQNVVGYEKLTDEFPEADIDTVAMMIDAAGKLAEEICLPLRRKMDLEPVRLEGDEVTFPEGVGEALAAINEAGLAAVSAPQDYGGLGLPVAVMCATNEILGSANLALELCPLLTQGQIEALEAHGTDAQKSEILPKLASGEWSGTMLLTESMAGSDVGALKTKAEPHEGTGEGDSYLLSGQKIFISWGEHPFAQNICHLTLARLPDAPAGPKGISLFYVPKFLKDGTRNPIKCISLEHKLGIHGSPTCVMELNQAEGWLIGEPHQGLAAMFTMMNNARLGVGVQGVSIAEAAYQDAAQYAKERVQGRSSPSGTIIDHADVRRMLIEMNARAKIARALAMDCAIAIDLGKTDPAMKARAGVLTPLAKSYGTDVGAQNAHDCVQVYGGMGYIEETGVAQYYRDVRVTQIYEGTNGIQAMDLVGRKMADDGQAIYALIDSLEDDILKHDLHEATKSMLARSPDERAGDAVEYQQAFAQALGAHYLYRGSQSSPLWQALWVDYEARMIPKIRASLLALREAPRPLYMLDAEAF